MPTPTNKIYSITDFNLNELQNIVIHPLGSDPGTVLEGQMYYNTNDKFIKYYNGSLFYSLISFNDLFGTGDVYHDGDGNFSLNTIGNIGTGNFLKINISSTGLVDGYENVSDTDIISVLGFTPYDAANPNDYVSLTSISATSPINYNNSTGVISFSAQSVNSILAGPSSGGAAAPTFRSLVVSDLPTITVAKGGTFLTTVAAGSIIAANSLDTFSAVTSTSGLKSLQNSAGTISWITTTGTGDNVYATSPTFITDLTTPKIIGGSAVGSGLIYQGSTNISPTSTAIAHSFQGGVSGNTVFASIRQDGRVVFNNSGGALSGNISKSFVVVDTNGSQLQIGEAGGISGYTNLWFSTSVATSSNYSFQANGTSQTSMNAPTNVFLRISNTSILNASATGITLTPIATSGGLTQFTFTAAAHTALTASTDIPGVYFNMSATRQFATGAKATQSEFDISAPTYSAVGASVITEAATLHITGAPIAGTNITITNSYAAIIAGNVKLGSGTQGFIYRSNTSSGLYATFYSANVTPSNTNHFFMHNGGTSIINATSSGNLQLAIDANAIMIVALTAITAAQQFTFRTGTTTAGQAPFILTATGAVLNGTPAQGAMEIGSGGQLYFSPIASQRKFVGLWGYVAKTANYTATVNDYTIHCTANSFTVTLPSAAASVTGEPAGRVYIIKNTDAGATITIATTGGELVDGGAAPSIVGVGVLRFQSTLTGWILI